MQKTNTFIYYWLCSLEKVDVGNLGERDMMGNIVTITVFLRSVMPEQQHKKFTRVSFKGFYQGDGGSYYKQVMFSTKGLYT